MLAASTLRAAWRGSLRSPARLPGALPRLPPWRPCSSAAGGGGHGPTGAERTAVVVSSLKEAMAQRRRQGDVGQVIASVSSKDVQHTSRGAPPSPRDVPGAVGDYVEPAATTAYNTSLFWWAILGSFLLGAYFVTGPQARQGQSEGVLLAARELRLLRRRSKRALAAVAAQRDVAAGGKGTLCVWDTHPHPTGRPAATILLPAGDGDTAAVWGSTVACLAPTVRVLAFHNPQAAHSRLTHRPATLRAADIDAVVQQCAVQGQVVVAASGAEVWGALLWQALRTAQPREAVHVRGTVAVHCMWKHETVTEAPYTSAVTASRSLHSSDALRQLAAAPEHPQALAIAEQVPESPIAKTFLTVRSLFGVRGEDSPATRGNVAAQRLRAASPLVSGEEEDMLLELAAAAGGDLPVKAVLPHPDALPTSLMPEVATAVAAKGIAGALVLSKFAAPGAWEALSALPPADASYGARLAAARGHVAKVAKERQDAGRSAEEAHEGLFFRLVDPVNDTVGRVAAALGLASVSDQPLVGRMLDRVQMLQGSAVTPVLLQPEDGQVYSLPLQVPGLLAQQVLDMLDQQDAPSPK